MASRRARAHHAIPQFVSELYMVQPACSQHICTPKKVDKMIHICVMIKLMCVSPTLLAEDCTSYWRKK